MKIMKRVPLLIGTRIKQMSAAIRGESEFDRLVSDIAALHGTGRLYQPIEHPYFKDWSVQRTAACVSALVNHMKENGGLTHLDIGCCTGYMCRTAYRAGLSSTGIDRNPRVIDIAQRLNKLFNTDVRFLHDENFEDTFKNSRFDVVTCLSVLHHMLKKNQVDKYIRSVLFLLSISSCLIMDLPKSDRRRYNSRGIPLNVRNFVDFIQTRTSRSIKNVHEFGVYTKNRPIFAIETE